MRQGTEGFFGERLTQARESKGWTQTELAKLLGVERMTVSKYERSYPLSKDRSATPSPDIFFKIAQLFDLSPSFFLREIPSNPINNSLFRKKKAVTERKIISTEIRGSWAWELFIELNKYIKFPQYKLPRASVSHLHLTNEDLESQALKLREVVGLSEDEPIERLMPFVESSGVIVFRVNFPSKDIEGFSFNHEDRSFIFLNVNIDNPMRLRSTLAHELSHLVLHKEKSSSLQGLQEIQANYSAGAFLLPKKAFSRDFRAIRSLSLENIRQIKLKWNVSIQLIIQRAYNLNLISDHERQLLYRYISRRGWRMSEPNDDLILIEDPVLIKKSIEVCNEKNKTKHILNLLGLGPKQIKEVANLDLKTELVTQTPEEAIIRLF